MQAEAKDAFKELLASVSCGGEWTWEQAMRLIVNDGRYGALKSLGEKKQCFNEYVQQRRNEEKDEERRKTRQVCGLVVCGLGCVVCGLCVERIMRLSWSEVLRLMVENRGTCQIFCPP